MSFLQSMLSIYPVLFLTGFTVGYGHCIGMCGPLAVSVSLSADKEKVYLPHILYNTGRIFTYSMLGGMLGFFGSFTQFAIAMVMIQKGVLLMTGLLVMVMGLAMTEILPEFRIFSDSAKLGKMFGRGFKYLSGKRSRAVYLLLGMLMGLLPCGPVYAALVAAARMGMEAETSLSGVILGMGALFSFGLGTAPALLLLGKLTNMGLLKWRRSFYRFGAFLMIGMGFYFIYRVFH